MASQEALYTNKIFLCGALPLLKTIVADVPSLSKKFRAVHCIYQVSALDPDAPCGKYATHFQVNCDEWIVHANKVDPKPYIDLEFKSVDAMNAFFKGKISPATLPKMKGICKHPGEFVAFLTALLKMANLLSTGISTLNKMGHEKVHDWALKSPDRVYAWAVEGEPSVSAYLRVKAGKTKAGKGEYKRAMPFFTMKFDCLDSALGILMSIDDMLESTRQGKLIMEGAPEFGAQIGEYMMLVGGLAK